ncbi:MAG: DpnI domain-containing protein [Verrucomicrobiota bacterium]
MTGKLAAAYQSGSQRARVVTESWGESNLYCPNSDKSRAPVHHPYWPGCATLRRDKLRLPLARQRSCVKTASLSSRKARFHLHPASRGFGGQVPRQPKSAKLEPFGKRRKEFD